MSRVTRFAACDRGLIDRVTGFISHLRLNGMRLGIGESSFALESLSVMDAFDIADVRRVLRPVCTGCKDDVARFDSLFDAFWLDSGRVRTRVSCSRKKENSVPSLTRGLFESDLSDTGQIRSTQTVSDGDGDVESGGIGRLVGSRVNSLMRKDLRDLVTAETIAEAERAAQKIGAAFRDRRSRRRIASRRGEQLHFRRTIRKGLSTGGEILHFVKKRRPDRTCKIVVLCDVSGSMADYSRVFLAFMAGLVRNNGQADAYLFHTQLVRITEALRDKDMLRAIGRMSLLAEGFGGGTKIGESLYEFAMTYARRFVDGRSVVLIFSDGYDTGDSTKLGDALSRLRKRGCRIIWLNPLKSWDCYEPISMGMVIAGPYLDLLAAAGTLNDLMALEPEFAQL